MEMGSKIGQVKYDDLHQKAWLVAELLCIDFRTQFCVYVKGHDKWMNAIMQFSADDYQNWIKEVNAIPDEGYERFKKTNRVQREDFWFYTQRRKVGNG